MLKKKKIPKLNGKFVKAILEFVSSNTSVPET